MNRIFQRSNMEIKQDIHPVNQDENRLKLNQTNMKKNVNKKGPSPCRRLRKPLKCMDDYIRLIINILATGIKMDHAILNMFGGIRIIVNQGEKWQALSKSQGESALFKGNIENLKILFFSRAQCGSIILEKAKIGNAFMPPSLMENQQNSCQEQNMEKYAEDKNSKNKMGKIATSIRGRGCDASKLERKIAKQQEEQLNQGKLPSYFVSDLVRYLNIIINKAQSASDEQLKEEILLAIQWFTEIREHFNTLCIDSKSAASFYDLIISSIPSLLKSSVTYVRISGFLCIQVLQIINDLCRILFTFFSEKQQKISQNNQIHLQEGIRKQDILGEIKPRCNNQNNI